MTGILRRESFADERYKLKPEEGTPYYDVRDYNVKSDVPWKKSESVGRIEGNELEVKKAVRLIRRAFRGLDKLTPLNCQIRYNKQVYAGGVTSAYWQMTFTDIDAKLKMYDAEFAGYVMGLVK